MSRKKSIMERVVSVVVILICIIGGAYFTFTSPAPSPYSAPSEELTYCTLSDDGYSFFIAVLTPDGQLKLSEISKDGQLHSASFDIIGSSLVHVVGPVYLNKSCNFITFSKSGMPIVTGGIKCTYSIGYTFEVGHTYEASFEYDENGFKFDHKQFPQMRRVRSENDLLGSELKFLVDFANLVTI